MAGTGLSPEELSDLIGLVYDSAFEENQWKSLIDRLCALFPGTMACVYGYDGEFDAVTASCSSHGRLSAMW